jgi:DNA repair exonuclease SbcCD ATPase subunit
VRPLRLKLNGLRSYRAEQEINFTEVDLMAIIGDTGAGKSSLLEALCVALYGCCTWDARSAKPLIADGGAATLQVQLTFRAGDQTWRVTRAISRGPYPPPVHLLECLDDGTRIDNADPVNAAIRRLIGLDFTTFLKAVVLPQGRFQVLLQMSNTDRAPILKSILGLDQLTTVREQVLTLAARLRPQLAALQTHRARLLPDPQAAAADARTRLGAATKRGRILDDAKAQVAAAQAAEQAASTRATAVQTAAERIAAAAADGADAAYLQLTALDTQLTTDLSGIDEVAGGLEQQERDLDAALASADAAGVGPAGLAAAATTLTTLIGELPDLDTEQARCSAEATAIATDRDALQTRRTAISKLRTAAEQAEAAAVAAGTAASAATDKVNNANAGLTAARTADQAAHDTATTAATAQAALELREQEAAAAARDAQAAEHAHNAAADHLEVVRRANAAAHLASASHVGDPCPVCQRTLPDDFVAPTPPDEDDAVTADAEAEKRAKMLTKQATTAAANRDNARIARDDATAAAAKAALARDGAFQHAEQLLGAVDLTSSDPELLAALQQVAEDAIVDLETARTAEQEARDAATAATAELAPLEQALTARDDALATARTALGRRAVKVKQAATALPLDYRMADPLTVDALNARLAHVKQRQGELERTTESLTGIRRQLGTVRAERDKTRQRHRTEVEQPASELRRRVELLGDRAEEAATFLGGSGPPPRAIGGLDQEAAWARRVIATARDLTVQCGKEVETQQRVAHQAKADAAAACAAAGAADIEELERLLITAAADTNVATRDLRIAEAQVPVAAELDRRITSVQPFLSALDELARLLADGKFIGAVVKRKQRALLGVASELLGSMTDSRFGFAEGFQIVDGLTGQPRDVKTLSGGETFLASLALALALVELAGRGGGRLEALFLDEGFGSLDANSLSDALDALGRQAEGGRLVAVISHLRAVAENIEHVLLVTKGPGGSEAHWVQGAERDQLVTDEMRAGLLA